MSSSLRKTRVENGILTLAFLFSACGSQLSRAIPGVEIARQDGRTAGAANQSTATLSAANSNPAAADSTIQPLLIINVGSSDFHASDPHTVKLDSGKIQFVEFFAYWDAVCKAMAPTVHNLERLYGDQINFIYLDRDDPATSSLQEQLGYIYQPHFFLLDPHGVVLAQWRGYVPGIDLQGALADALGR